MIRVGSWLTGFFFLLMLVFPTVLQFERGMLLALLLYGSILMVINSPNRWCISRPLVYWLIVCETYSIFSIWWGVLNDAQGAIAVSTVYVLWPILYVYFIGFAKNVERYVFLQKILIIGVFLAALSGILLVASNFFPVLGILKPYFELLGGGLGFHENAVEYDLYNMTTAIYGLPFLIAFLALGSRTLFYFSRPWKAFSVICLLVCFFLMLISGRRAFIVVGLLSVPLVLTLMTMVITDFQFKYAIKIVGVYSVIIICALLIFSTTINLPLAGLVDYFLNGFEFDDANNFSASRRAEQFSALIGE